MLCESDICSICQDPSRHNGQLCVVESVFDMMAIEGSGAYKGRYFVLNGVLSPLNGLGPEELKLPRLKALLHTDKVSEIVMALSPSVEGEATSHYISSVVAKGIKVTRIGFGVPFGGELEYLDQKTLFHAFSSRQNM